MLSAEQVTEELLWELMLQAGPVGTQAPAYRVHAQLNRNRAGRAVNVHVPKDKISGTHNNFGFVEFRSEEVGASTARKIRAELP